MRSRSIANTTMNIRNTGPFYFGTDGTSFRGVISMSSGEWREALRFLFRGARRWRPSYPWVIEMLRKDIKRPVVRDGGRVHEFAVRVPATEAIVERFKPTGVPPSHRYKRQNYVIRVTI